MSDALLGVIVGAALTGIISWTQFLHRHCTEAIRIRHALAGEIGSIVQLVKQREFEEEIRSLARHMEVNNIVGSIEITIKQNYCRVFEAYVGNIGALGRESRDVSRFYTKVFGVMDNFTAMSTWGSHLSPGVPGNSVKIYNSVADTIRELVILGKDLEYRLGA